MSEGERQTGQDQDLIEEIESFRSVLEREYEQKIAAVNKKGDEMLKTIQEMYIKKMGSLVEELDEQERKALSQAGNLEQTYKGKAERLIEEIDKSKLIESILHDISKELWPGLDDQNETFLSKGRSMDVT
ncbi:MAG TPA: hypothetical protein PLR17_00825 [Acetomicrobium flavidum]|uniref:hypothetical protein n=1 Tax=Acetomicrobium flavidum TaxID=49896 RepID=UPI002B897090|nr:hypothetical protein [Acetomicrobium flavidum]HOM30908.1 hypothetical protein [Acetomicrobium flavidum]